MGLFRERRSDFREKIILPSKSQTNQFFIFCHRRIGLENKFFPKKITQSPTYTTFMLSLSNSFGETMHNWTAQNYNLMQHTIVLDCSQNICTLHSICICMHCICLKGRPKQEIRPDFLCSTSFKKIYK